MQWIIANPLFIFIGFILLLSLTAFLLKITSSKRLHYRQRNALFSPAERSFLGVLERAINDEYLNGRYRILGKVRIADVLTPAKGMNRKHWQIAFNKILDT